MRQVYNYLLIVCHFSCELGQCLIFSKYLENKTELIQFLNIIDKGLIRESSHNLTVLIDISSKPWALLMSRFLIILSISLSSQVMEENLASVLKTTESGI